MIGLAGKRAHQVAAAEKQVYSEVADKLDRLMLSLHMNLATLSIANVIADTDGVIDELSRTKVPSQPAKNVVDNARIRLSTLRGSLEPKMGAMNLIKTFAVAYVTIFEGVVRATKDKDVLNRYQQMCKTLGDELVKESQRANKGAA